ncbi:hypothetical protein D3C72_2455180 [compost metagenome]
MIIRDLATFPQQPRTIDSARQLPGLVARHKFKRMLIGGHRNTGQALVLGGHFEAVAQGIDG